MSVFSRLLSAKELADLPQKPAALHPANDARGSVAGKHRWGNGKVDERQYTVSTTTAYEVDEATFEAGKDAGLLFLGVDGKYYLGEG